MYVEQLCSQDMQLSHNQAKLATMSNNANNFTNYFNIQGKVMNIFGHQQSKVRLIFFEDSLTYSTEQTDTNANSEASSHNQKYE